MPHQAEPCTILCTRTMLQHNRNKRKWYELLAIWLKGHKEKAGMFTIIAFIIVVFVFVSGMAVTLLGDFIAYLVLSFFMKDEDNDKSNEER